MLRRVASLVVVSGVGLAAAGCALTLFGFEPRAAWRDAEERACMARGNEIGLVNYTPVTRVDGRGACGIYAPLNVVALNDASVAVTPAPTLGCPMAAGLDAWLAASVQPAAVAWFGVPVVEIQQIAAYACRSVDNIPGERLSEHAFGNAIDVAGFRLADGRVVTVKRDFRVGEPRARGFLHEVYAAACARFKTVLGPGEAYHEDHFHLDLAHHNAEGTSRYCSPKPDVVPPDRAPYGGSLVASRPVLPAIRAILGLDRRSAGSVD
jgi:hypothetical protein